MIDKDAILHIIDINIEPHAHGEWDSGYNVALSEMREKIKQMPTVETEPDKDWISVKDRLPDDEKRYLICTEKREIYIAYYQPISDKFSDSEPFWQGDSCKFTTCVTHWQPLPKPPKGGIV